MVAYHMGAMWPERVEKVVIASSGVNMRVRDNVDLLNRANAHKIEELLLPAKAAQLRALLGLAVYRRAYYMPDFLLNDVIHVRFHFFFLNFLPNFFCSIFIFFSMPLSQNFIHIRRHANTHTRHAHTISLSKVPTKLIVQYDNPLLKFL